MAAFIYEMSKVWGILVIPDRWVKLNRTVSFIRCGQYGGAILSAGGNCESDNFFHIGRVFAWEASERASNKEV